MQAHKYAYGTVVPRRLSLGGTPCHATAPAAYGTMVPRRLSLGGAPCHATAQYAYGTVVPRRPSLGGIDESAYVRNAPPHPLYNGKREAWGKGGLCRVLNF